MVRIGSLVTYVSTSNIEKVGLVVATADSVDQSTEAGKRFGLSGNQVNLVVFNMIGGHSPRLAVPFEDDVKDHPDFSGGGFYRLMDDSPEK